MKQEKLFAQEEKEKEEEELRERRRQVAIERREDYKKHMEMHHAKTLTPKQEYYTCSCGLRMHWKVAWGRRDGCPQCNKKFKKEDILLVPEDT